MSDHKVEIDVRLNTDEVEKDFDQLEKEARSGAQSVAGVLDSMSDDLKDAGKKAKDMGDQYADASDDMRKASEEAGRSAGDLGDSVRDLGEDLEESTDKASIFGDVLKGSLASAAIEKGVSALAGGIQSAFAGASDLQAAEGQLAASTGAAKEEMEGYSQVMRETWESGYGDSIYEVADGMALVRQYTHETDPEKVKALTENVTALSDTFGMDFSESLRGVDALMTNMGLSADEAFDYMVTGAQNGLDRSGELADNIAEYSQLWGQAGFSAEEMFTILQNGLDSGAYNLDKVNDFVKEFGISLSDGRIQANLDSFSEGTRELFAAWQDGEASTKDVFYSVIRDLSQMENQQEALTIASSTWSALGEDNAMAVITALDDVKDTYADVRGSMESLKTVKYDSITNQYKTLGRTFQTQVAVPVLTKFLPAAQKGMDLLADHIDTIVPVATAAGAAMGAMWVTKKASSFLSHVRETGSGILELVGRIAAHTEATAADTVVTSANTAATGAQAAASEAAAAAQTGLNTAMGASPVFMLVAGVTAFLGVLSLFRSDSEDTGTVVEELNEKVTAMGDSLEESREQLSGTLETAAASVEDAQTRAVMASSAADELAGLAEQTSLTSEEQERMASLVGQLNSLYPEMGLEIDSVTGKLNMGSDEILAYVDNMKRMALAEAYTRAAAESYDAVVEATTELTKAQETQGEVSDTLLRKKGQLSGIEAQERARQEDLEEATRKYNEALASGSDEAGIYAEQMAQLEDRTYEVNGETVSYGEAVRTLTDEIGELEGQQEEAAAAVQEQQAAVDAATASADSYMEKAGEMNESDAARKASVEGVGQAYGETAQASITAAGQELEAFNSLSADMQGKAVDVANSVLSMQESITGTLESQMNMFEEFRAGTEITKEQILSNMQSQVDGVAAWEQNMNTLMTETKTMTDGTVVAIDEGLMQYLASLGPEGSTYVQEFVNMSGDELAKANELWSQSVDIKSMSNDWGQELSQSIGELAAGGAEDWNELAESLNMEASESGEYVVQGLVDGMEKAKEQLEAAGESAGESLLENLDTGLGVASPSRKAMQSGVYVDAGLVKGLQMSAGVVETAARSVGNGAIAAILELDLEGQAYRAGISFGNGLALGIQATAGQIADQAARTVRDAIEAANRAQDAHSPARETMKVGRNFAMGEVIGIREMMPEIRRAGKESVGTALRAAKESTLGQGRRVYAEVYRTVGENGWRAMPFPAAGQSGGDRSGSPYPDSMGFDYDRMAAATAQAMEGMTVEVDERQFGRVVRKVAAV